MAQRAQAPDHQETTKKGSAASLPNPSLLSRFQLSSLPMQLIRFAAHGVAKSRWWAFHQLYHGMASTYDAVASLVSLGRWRAWVNVVLPFLAGPRILEIGYGTGHLMANLSADRAIRAVGLDESRQMARLARRRVALRVPLLRGMAQRLPFCAESFETVVSTFPSEYISDTHTVSEIYRVLAPGGRLVILPLARIVGDRRPSRATARLLAFLVHLASGTQEQAVVSLGKTLSELGFKVSTHHVQLPLSVVVVVQAIK